MNIKLMKSWNNMQMKLLQLWCDIFWAGNISSEIDQDQNSYFRKKKITEN